MVSFRKLSMAFAGFALAGAIASAAVTPITCTVTAQSPALKLEGLTEQIGDINLSCKLIINPNVTVGTLLGTFQVMTDGPQFTNQLADKDARTLATPTITVGANPASAIKGVLSADGKAVTFNLIDISDFGPAVVGADLVENIVISGLKINAQQSQGNLTSPKVKVSAISYNDSNKPISLVNETQAVGTVQQAVVFAGKAAASNLDCSAYSPSAAGLAAVDDGTNGTNAARKALAKVQFTANFPNSLAGVKLTARFNVPSGAKLFMATSNISTATGAWIADAAGQAFATSDAANIQKFVELKANSSGIYQAVWTVTRVNTGTDTYAFPVYITIPQNFVSSDGLTAVGSIGPFSTVTSATDAALADVPEPRFVTPTTTSSAMVSVGSCNTTLLFPYVTNAGNWDTGIAISNPTADMIGADGKWVSGGDTAKTAQNGTCTLYFIGDNAPAKAIQSSSIAAGKTVAFLVSAGSTDYGITGAPGFNGYLKVSCTFSEGRGFAFMSSADLGGVGVGYVAEKGIVLVP